MVLVPTPLIGISVRVVGRLSVVLNSSIPSTFVEIFIEEEKLSKPMLIFSIVPSSPESTFVICPSPSSSSSKILYLISFLSYNLKFSTTSLNLSVSIVFE